MAEKPIQTPAGEEGTPTPEGTEGEETPEKTTPATDELPEAGKATPEVDYKKKFSDSAREVQRILQESKLEKEKIAELEAKLAEKVSATPSNEEMLNKYPDWEEMTETERILTIKQEETERKLAKVLEEKEWQGNFAKAKKNFPELAEYEEEFQDFCLKEPKANVETLAKSFLFDKNLPEKKEDKPRKGLEKPTGGTKTPMPEGWTAEEVARLRTTDEKKYFELVRKGVIKAKDIK